MLRGTVIRVNNVGRNASLLVPLYESFRAETIGALVTGRGAEELERSAAGPVVKPGSKRIYAVIYYYSR